LAQSASPLKTNPSPEGGPAVAEIRRQNNGRARRFISPRTSKGKIVLLDFWATWCPDCYGYIPGDVDAFAKYHDRGFEKSSASHLTSRTGADTVKSFHQRKQNDSGRRFTEGSTRRTPTPNSTASKAFPIRSSLTATPGKIIAAGDDAEGRRAGPGLSKSDTANAPAKPTEAIP